MCPQAAHSLLLLPTLLCKTPYHKTCRAWLQSECCLSLTVALAQCNVKGHAKHGSPSVCTVR